MVVTIASRIGVEAVRSGVSAGIQVRRNTTVTFVRADLAKGIAEQLLAGKNVLLLDVDIKAPLFGEKISVAEQVREALGARTALIDNIVNLDHHAAGCNSTATEEVFSNLAMIRGMEGDVAVVINHGDTDSLISSFVANNADRIFSAAERSLLIAAARAGDHGEGDPFLATDRLAPGVRLNFAMETLCVRGKLELRRVWGTDENLIGSGVERTYALLDRVLADSRAVHSTEVSLLIDEHPFRMSYRVIDEAAQGREVPGISIDRSIEGYPIVAVNLSTPGLNDFDPVPAYKTTLRPAILLMVRNDRLVGIGRSNEHKDWLDLSGSTNGIVGFYDRVGLRIKGGAHAGGANVARTPEGFASLPTPEEGLVISRQFLADSLSKRGK